MVPVTTFGFLRSSRRRRDTASPAGRGSAAEDRADQRFLGEVWVNERGLGRGGAPNGRIASTSNLSGMSSSAFTLSSPLKPTQFEPTPSAQAVSSMDWMARLASETANRVLSM